MSIFFFPSEANLFFRDHHYAEGCLLAVVPPGGLRGCLLSPQGGIMGIEIYWDCNLDRWFHHCRPKYSFRRLDDKTAKESSYPGYNFR